MRLQASSVELLATLAGDARRQASLRRPAARPTL